MNKRNQYTVMVETKDIRKFCVVADSAEEAAELSGGEIKMLKGKDYDRKELKRLQTEYLTTEALYETLRNEREMVEKSILERHLFCTETRTKRITKLSETFRMDNKDFDRYLDLCHEEYKKRGIADKRGKEYYPESEAYDLFKEAEKSLIEFGLNLAPSEEFKETLRQAIKVEQHRKKFIEITLLLEGEE